MNTPDKNEDPQVTMRGILDMQVCVPETWDDEAVRHFANTANLCGTTNGWFVRKQGDRLLAGCDERVCCHERSGYVHIMLDC